MLGTQQGTVVQAMRFAGSIQEYWPWPHLPPQGDADLLHLLGAHVVGAHDEALGVLIEEGGELGEVVGLPGGFVLPNHLGN